jgi:hypothetical protein
MRWARAKSESKGPGIDSGKVPAPDLALSLGTLDLLVDACELAGPEPVFGPLERRTPVDSSRYQGARVCWRRYADAFCGCDAGDS